MSKPLYELTIEEAAAGLAKAEFTSAELTEACLQRIEDLDSALNCYVSVLPELAREQAAASDARRAQGESRGMLDGIPYSLKDVYATADSPATASSHILEYWMPPYSATVYTKLHDAGAVLLGKTNTDEFTMGVSTETSYFGVTRNPWDRERVSGGSSGGPAAAVAAHFGIFSIGTDTGGSIRQPAAFCGVTGLRPTYGRVSRWGEIAMASSLDQTGPVTKTARDAAVVLQTLAGHDPYDATSSPEPVDAYLEACDQPLKGKRIGVPKEYFGEGVKPEVEALVRTALDEYKKLGATVKEVSLPSVQHALAAYYIIAPAEVSSNMARYDGIRYGHSIERDEPEVAYGLYDIYAKSRAAGLGAEVQRRIIMGTHVLSAGYYDAYYKKAEAVRAVVSAEFNQVFQEVDLLIAPVSPHTAFKIGEQVDDPLAMYKEDILTVPVNIGGVPGISIPCGQVDGLPVGLQLIAARFQEATLLNAAAAYQSVTNHHQQFPKLTV
jgi:aspartyl-tRNA(Asn)/glutamyl-tRNA(Gln) amidotransferase subunit A